MGAHDDEAFYRAACEFGPKATSCDGHYHVLGLTPLLSVVGVCFLTGLALVATTHPRYTYCDCCDRFDLEGVG